MKRKGAVELSLGFIVMVVFAVILLSLAIVWLQGVIRDIGGLTTDLTQQSANKIQEIFGETGENFAVWPSSYSMSAGKGIKLLAGIKNNARDGQPHRFVINIVPSTASNEVCPERDITTCSVSGGGGTLYDFMASWLTFDTAEAPVSQGATHTPWVEIKIPSSAVKGTYMFNVYCCYDAGTSSAPVFSDCDSNVGMQNLWGGSAKSVVLTVN
jgi:hypothetical protein